ncbi:TCR/Tet family MFS transporter [Sandarakinorhabdus sp. DWP1-3-1]|uniref:TCR/Tet family MFS transporter n=1 Tax=Sandarakinorhabdus sp. DWP1-3-1 TaxID=2804627 RepID=UPI003CF04F99
MTADRSARRALAFLFVTVLIDAIGFGIVIPVFPALIVRLTGRSVAGAAEVAGLIMFLYAITQFVCGPIIGGLSDRFGRRPVLLASLAAFGLDYLAMAFAPTLGWLIAARLVAGVTGASFPTAYAYIADISPPEKRAPNFGVIGMAFGFGFIIGPALGGIVAQYDARLPFLLAAGLALANVAYGYFVLPESLKPENRRRFEWRRANPVGALLRLRAAHPRVLMLALTVLLWTMGYQSLYATWSYFGIERFDWTPGEVGWSLAAVGVTGALVQGVLSRRLIPRYGARNIVIAGVFSGIGGYLIYAFAGVGWMMYVGITVAALQGLVFPSLQGMMSAGVAPSEQGELQGAVSSIQSLSSIMGPPVMTGSFAYFSSPGAPFYLPGAPFVLAAVFSVLTLVTFFRAVAMGAGATNARAAAE